MEWELRDVLYAANIGTNVLLWLLYWRERKGDKTAARFGAVDRAIAGVRTDMDKGRARATSELATLRTEVEGRLTELEATARQAPTHDDLGALHEKINEVSAGVAGLRGEFQGVRNTLQLIHETLMRGGGRP